MTDTGTDPGDTGTDRGEEHQPPGGSGPAELLLGTVGTVLTVALLAFLAYEAFLTREGGPALSAEVVRLERQGEQVVARVEVRNSGGQTAEDVQVTGRVRREGDVVQESTATLSYVPPDSRRSAALVFTSDPERSELQVAVEGYALP